MTTPSSATSSKSRIRVRPRYHWWALLAAGALAGAITGFTAVIYADATTSTIGMSLSTLIISLLWWGWLLLPTATLIGIGAAALGMLAAHYLATTGTGHSIVYLITLTTITAASSIPLMLWAGTTAGMAIAVFAAAACSYLSGLLGIRCSRGY